MNTELTHPKNLYHPLFDIEFASTLLINSNLNRSLMAKYMLLLPCLKLELVKVQSMLIVCYLAICTYISYKISA